jgi:hypothetical protein
MIFEGDKPDYNEIIKSAESVIPIRCKHDELFWSQMATMEYGDVCLCQRCNQYFTKIKTMPRVVRRQETFRDTDAGKLKVTLKPAANHWDRICVVRVPVRLLDDKETNNES